MHDPTRKLGAIDCIVECPHLVLQLGSRGQQCSDVSVLLVQAVSTSRLDTRRDLCEQPIDVALSALVEGCESVGIVPTAREIVELRVKLSEELAAGSDASPFLAREEHVVIVVTPTGDEVEENVAKLPESQEGVAAGRFGEARRREVTICEMLEDRVLQFDRASTETRLVRA
jgi:hypothetical protein